ncbi:MAG: hypothetical protein AAB424_03275 [Patescibacteria group bacterium]
MANHWSRERVLSEIKRRHRKEWRLNLQYVQQNCRSLYYQAVKHFANWRTAVTASGFNYDEIRQYKASSTWTRNVIIVEIQKRHSQVLAINSREICLHHSALYCAACSRFGSWKKAVQAADIDYAKISMRTWGYWNKKTVITAIRKRSVLNKSLCVTAARKGDKSLSCLITAAQAHFGTWRNAIKAAGLNDQELLRMSNRHWTIAKIIRGIRKRFRAGKSLGFRTWSREDPTLYVAVMKHIGSRELGIRLAGLDPLLTGGKQSWTTTRILECIHLVHKNDESLAPSCVNRNHRPLFVAATQYFGSWRAAMAAAGFNYELNRKNQGTCLWLASLDRNKTDRIIQRTLDMIAEEKQNSPRRKHGSSKRTKHRAHEN